MVTCGPVGALEQLARQRAAKLGYRVHRSRRRKGRENAGELMLSHKASSTVLLGAGYTATAEMILEFIERERTKSQRYSPRRLVADLLRSMCY